MRSHVAILHAPLLTGIGTAADLGFGQLPTPFREARPVTTHRVPRSPIFRSRRAGQPRGDLLEELAIGTVDAAAKAGDEAPEAALRNLPEGCRCRITRSARNAQATASAMLATSAAADLDDLAPTELRADSRR